jgi:transcription termination factor Rho
MGQTIVIFYQLHMQQLFLIMPGTSDKEVWAQPLKGGLPMKLAVGAEPWDVLRIDLKDSPLKVYSLYSPKKYQPKDRLFRAAAKKLRFGKGQKILVPAPPASGKTTLMHNLGQTIMESKKGVVTNIMIDERPEETLYGKTINLNYMRSASDIIEGLMAGIGEVMARVTEKGTDEVIIIDSMTRLIQVVNTVIQKDYPDLPSGTGGIALQARKFVRQIFGLANRLPKGSLTIIATSLVGGSPIEDVIYKDLQGVSTAEIFIAKDSTGKIIIDPKKSYVRDQHKII